MSWAKEFKITNNFKQKIEKSVFANCVWVSESSNMYILSPFHIKIYNSVISSGPPFSDSFIMHFRYNIIEIPGPNPSTKFRIEYSFQIVKSVMWTSVIKSESMKRSAFWAEHVTVPYIQAGIDLYYENPQTRLDYNFHIEELIEEEPEIQIRNLKTEMLDQLNNLKAKNTERLSGMSTDLKSLEKKLLFFQIGTFVLVLVAVCLFYFKK